MNPYATGVIGIQNASRENYYNGCDWVGTLDAALLNRTDPPTGYYYNGGAYFDDFVIPRIQGVQVWRLPTETDFAELFAASVSAFGDDKALRHPAFLSDPPDHANAWGLNFVENGYFDYHGSCNPDIRYVWPNIYYVINNTAGYDGSVSSGVTYQWNTTAGTRNEYGTGANVRLIYTADGE
jgi:hypothetical protein